MWTIKIVSCWIFVQSLNAASTGLSRSNVVETFIGGDEPQNNEENGQTVKTSALESNKNSGNMANRENNTAHGKWSSWGEWSSCSATCFSSGARIRGRVCKDSNGRESRDWGICGGYGIDTIPCDLISRENCTQCSSNPCVHGRCTDGINDYTCKCKKLWTGKNCEQEIHLPCPPRYTRHYCNHQVGRSYGCWTNKCWASTEKSWCYSDGQQWMGYDWCSNSKSCYEAAFKPCHGDSPTRLVF